MPLHGRILLELRKTILIVGTGCSKQFLPQLLVRKVQRLSGTRDSATSSFSGYRTTVSQRRCDEFAFRDRRNPHPPETHIGHVGSLEVSNRSTATRGGW